MRRITHVVLFLALLGCGLFLVMRRGTPEPSPGSTANPTAPVLSSSPRLANTLLEPTAAVPRAPSSSDDVDARSDVGPLASDEQLLMQQIRESLKSNPRLAATLARECRRRFPDSPESNERDMLLVLSLFNQGNMLHASRETLYYFEHHPSGRYTRDLSRLTHVPIPPPQ